MSINIKHTESACTTFGNIYNDILLESSTILCKRFLKSIRRRDIFEKKISKEDVRFFSCANVN